jgi:hypothetical protein
MEVLKDRPLRELVIPGSHDAGTFVMENRIDNNSSKCQEISILEQLKAGSRYLDLRAWKAKDGLYWMYHGAAWTHVKLVDVLTDIKTFLDQSTGEIVIATLLIDDKTKEDAGWEWACQQVNAYMATPPDVKGKSFADVTLGELRSAGKRLVLLRSGAASQFACMDREGVWGNSHYPSVYVKALENYGIWSDKMWILHLGIPFTGDIGHTMRTRAEWNAKEFVPRFKGEKPDDSWLKRRLNIINVDFVEQFGWVDAIVRLNEHYPKTEPATIVPRVVTESFTWTLKAINNNGILSVEASAFAPFRAQQGQIHVYSAQNGFPADPAGKARAWVWDNEARPWNTGLKWTPGMCIAWVAEKSSDGPRVPFLKLTTATPITSEGATYTWKLRIGDDQGKLVLEGDTDAPFRAQKGQLHVYPQGSTFPSNPDGKAEKWKWDNEAHPWHVGVPYDRGRNVAWVAQQSPNGPNTLFLKATI